MRRRRKEAAGGEEEEEKQQRQQEREKQQQQAEKAQEEDVQQPQQWYLRQPERLREVSAAQSCSPSRSSTVRQPLATSACAPYPVVRPTHLEAGLSSSRSRAVCVSAGAALSKEVEPGPARGTLMGDVFSFTAAPLQTSTQPP